MKKIKRITVSIVVLSIFFFSVFFVKPNAVTLDELNHPSVFLKQKTPSTCTLVASTMLVRRAALASGNQNWSSITEDAVRSVAWINGVGLAGSFTYAGITVTHGYFTYDRATQLRDLLKSHPEGIVMYDWDYPHAILITDYTDGVFYCADSALGIPAGRIPNSQALVKVADADKYWYVSSPTISLTPDDVPVISGENAPELMSAGVSFSISGTVRSGVPLTDVTVGCYDANGTMKIGKSIDPGSTSYDLANLNSSVAFSKLSAGVYTYRVNASTAAGTTTLVEKAFTVLANEETVKSGIYYLRVNAKPGLSVAAKGRSRKPAAEMGIVTAANTLDQAYIITHTGNGCYTIQNRKTGLALDVLTGGSAGGIDVIQNTSSGKINQRWQILPTGKGYCLVPLCAPTACLDIYNGKIVNGGDLRVHTVSLSNAQRFRLVDARPNQTIKAGNVSKTIGERSFKLKVTLTDGNGTLTYRSANPKVATVSKTGTVTLNGVGKTTITITASGTDTHKKTTKTITVMVRPKGTGVTKAVSSAPGKLTVTWRKGSDISGYIIQYSKDADFDTKTAIAVSKSKLTRTVSKLEAGRYYVRVRTFKTVEQTRYYSTWSAAQRVRVKAAP